MINKNAKLPKVYVESMILALASVYDNISLSNDVKNKLIPEPHVNPA